MLNGKDVLLTGVASGIGLETARLLAADGARVVGVDLRQPPGDLPLAEFVQADLGSRDGIDAMLTRVPERLDGVVNVAGVPSSQPWLLQFKVNFLAARQIVQSTAGRLRDGASVVTVASGTGFRWRESIAAWAPLTTTVSYEDGLAWLQANPQEGLHSYSRSKEAIIIWTAQEAVRWVGTGRRLNAVSPGPVDTPMINQFRSALGNELIDSDIARGGRIGTPQDIAPVIAFLLSDASMWICGQDIAVDGGFAASMLTAP